MTSDTNRSRSRAQDAEVATGARRADADTVHVDAGDVVPVGTFAAGQSADGRHITATTAPQGSFAEGQEDEVAARAMIRPEVTQGPRPGASPHASPGQDESSPEAAETSPHAQSQHAD